jgi:hypothetical protein
VTNGYNLGMVDVFVNGVKFVNGTDFTATDGTTVALAAGLAAGNIVEIDNLLTAYLPTNALRTITTFTATAGQSAFSVSYTQGLIDVFYNGSCLAQSEYIAINGTSVTLVTACQVNDIVVVYAYSYSVGAYSGIGGSGTSGQVPYFTSSAAIASSPNHFWDATNNRLGIGTSTPSEKLEVYGNATATSNFTGLKLTNSADGGLKILFTNSVSAELASIVAGVTSAGAGTNDGNLIFSTADNAVSSERIRINSTGNLGIGVTPSAWATVGPVIEFTGGGFIGSQGSVNTFYVGSNNYYNGTNFIYKQNGFANAFQVGAGTGGFIWQTAPSGTAGGTISFTTAMALTSTGRLELKTEGLVCQKGASATVGGGSFFAVQQTAAGGGERWILQQLNTAYGLDYWAYNGSGWTVIANLSSAGVWYSIGGGTSDRRTKQNIEYINTSGIDAISLLKPVKFEFIKCPEKTRRGFIAQDVLEVIPDLVLGDGELEDGTYGLDYDGILALAVKAIQEMNTKIIELEKIVATK